MSVNFISQLCNLRPRATVLVLLVFIKIPTMIIYSQLGSLEKLKITHFNVNLEISLGENNLSSSTKHFMLRARDFFFPIVLLFFT